MTTTNQTMPEPIPQDVQEFINHVNRANPEPEQRECTQCRRTFPETAFSLFKRSNKPSKMCNKCRDIKNRYYHKKQAEKKERELIDNVAGEPVTRFGPVTLDDAACIDEDENGRFASIYNFLDFLEESSWSDNPLTIASYEGIRDDLPVYKAADHPEKEREANKQRIINEAKSHIHDFFTTNIAEATGYKWCTYRLTSGVSAIYATLYCSLDKNLVRPSTSKGRRDKKSKKCVDCKSSLKVTYNWSTGYMAITLVHLNHSNVEDVKKEEEGSQPKKKRKRSPKNPLAAQSEPVDPTIIQAQAQEYLKKILN